MVDTIVLTLSKNMFTITAPELFKPSAHWVLSEFDRNIISKQNPSKTELRNEIYKPRLTLGQRKNTHGNREVMLKVELSLPKLLLGNNFNELQQKDFPELIKKLVVVLGQMGVEVTATALEKASVITIHYAKNIVFTDGATPYHFINKIKQANIKLSLDVNQTDYRNEGHSHKWHCNAYEIAFYDKVRDLEMAKRSDKRSIEKDIMLSFEEIRTLQESHKLEVLRMEVRLNQRKKMKQLFKKLNITTTLTFKGLFKKMIAKKVLLHYIDELERTRPILLDYKPRSDQDLLAALIVNNPHMGPKKILQLYGLKKAYDVLTPRELRVMFAKYSTRSWYQFMDDARNITLPNARQATFGVLREQVEKMTAVRLSSYKSKRRQTISCNNSQNRAT